uniref:Protein lap4 n=1 Tax=Ascaris lumbricoides TaxID=6252 RepID=A0A0M3ILD7_ASCLU
MSSDERSEQHKSILSKGVEHKEHIKFVASEPQVKRAPISPAPPPTKVTAPVVMYGAKDEIELLRAGSRNVHGDKLRDTRSPAQQTNSGS